MSVENIFIGAYWSARKETRLECAQRTMKFLVSIAQQPVLSSWYFRARSRKAAVKPLEVSLEAIEKYLKPHNNDDGLPMVELGFSLGAWNGNDELSASFDVACGSFSKYVGNSAVVKLPRQEPPTDDESLKKFEGLLEKFIEAWNPDVAVVSSSEYITRAGGGTADEVGGWLTYRRGKGIVIKKPN